MNNYDKKMLETMLENLINKSDEVKDRINIILEFFPDVNENIINKEMFIDIRRNLDIFTRSTLKDYERL
jgi:hypothetical protein